MYRVEESVRSIYPTSMMVIDAITGLAIGDPEKSPFPTGAIPESSDINAAFEQLVLSASGWRKVFAASGDEESETEEISAADTVLAAGMAQAFADFILHEVPDRPDGATGGGGSPHWEGSTGAEFEHPVIAIGIDARYTGPVLAHIMVRVLLAEGFRVRYLFITAAPEIMAYVRSTPGVNGFVYISASHNPVGHNGVKFGLNDGGVLSGDKAAVLIESFRKLADDRVRLAEICRRAGEVPAVEVTEVFSAVEKHKKQASDLYYSFSRFVVSGLEDKQEQEDFFNALKEKSRARSFGIIAELNGSARSTSIDERIFGEAGFKIHMVNNRPRQIVHRIVPEGASLDLCRQELENMAHNDGAFRLGYVPDNDGDRGNLVYYNADTGKAEILEAQEVFALAVLAELAYLSWSGIEPCDGSGKFTLKVAVAINGPTSMRIDRVAERFGAQVFRAEVGEANVVGLARRLRTEGYTVRILGEGSNGGNITHPSAVRDPLNTVFALVKMLSLVRDGDKPGMFDLWLALLGLCRDDVAADKDFGIASVLGSMPQFTTTSAFEPEAVMRISSADHGLFKKSYEKVFLTEWEKKRKIFAEKYGITGWEEINYEGTEEKRGLGPDFRSGNQKGGLKILFCDSRQYPLAYIWMRGSGTEPVFRILADVEGDNNEMERELLLWHRGMIEEADQNC